MRQEIKSPVASNEEQAADYVSVQNNTLKNKKMKKTNNQTDTPQAGEKVQLANGKSLVDQSDNKSFVDTILAYAGDKLPKKTKHLIPYQAAKAAGFKVVFLKGNRKVYNTQIENLWKSAKDSKQFTESSKVVPLRPILVKYPHMECEDISGNPITLDSPDVDKYLAVYDGQHRITVCELHPGEIDVLLELNDFNGTHPLEEIKAMNSFSKNWNCTDLRHSNIGAGYTTNKLYGEAEKLQKLYGITTKLSEYILTFKREATKKKDLVEGKDTTAYNEEHAIRGLGIFNATMMNFKGAREMKRLEFIDAVVYTYDKVSDKNKGSFARNMKIYMGTMDDAKRDDIKKIFRSKNFGQLKETINRGYEGFCKKNYSEQELTDMEKDIDKLIDSYILEIIKTNQAKGAKNPLKSGRVSELILHNSVVKETIEKEKLAKAEKKAADALHKAKEAQTVVDKPKVNNNKEM